MRIAIVFLVLVLTGCATGDFQKHQWRQVDTAHFSLISNAPTKKSETLARDLEKFRAIVLTIFGEALAEESVPTRIFLFDDWGTYFEYTRGNNMLGFTFPTLRANYIVISPGVYHTDQRRIVFHEYVHYLLRHRRSLFPAWYDEGFAEFLSDVRVDNGIVYVGNVPRSGINHLARAWLLPIDEVLNEDYDLTWPASRVSAFYSQSWAAVHYFLAGHNAGLQNRKPQLDRYLALLNEGLDRQRAFEASFDLSTDQLTKELQRYVKKRRLPGLALPLTSLKFNDELESRALAGHEVASQLGDLTLLAGEHKAQIAESLFSFTLHALPNNSPARSGLAISLAHQSRFEEALKQAQLAVAEDPNRATAHLDLAQILFGICESGYDPDNPQTCIELLETAKSHFERSIQLLPNALEAHAGMGMTLSRLQRDIPQAINHLNSANDLAQWMPQLSLELGKLYLQSGQQDLARRNLNHVVRWSKSGDLRMQARTLLASLSS